MDLSPQELYARTASERSGEHTRRSSPGAARRHTDERRMAPRLHNRPPTLPPLPCPLTYDANGRWPPSTVSAGRQCVLRNLERDLDWWRSRKGCNARALPDIDATLCRIRHMGPRGVLTNLMLVRSSNGRLSASILLDPGDERGPMRHWPAVRASTLDPPTNADGKPYAPPAHCPAIASFPHSARWRRCSSLRLCSSASTTACCHRFPTSQPS